jgi:hypothetical protein
MRLIVSAFFLCIWCSVSSAGISWTAELNAAGSPKVAFENTSDPGWSVKKIRLDFTSADLGTIVLDTTAGDGIGVDPVDPAFSQITSGTIGAFNTTVTDPSQITHVGSDIVGDINEMGGVEGRTMMFDFAQGTFGPGEGWGFAVDWDSSGTDDDEPSRSELSGATISVTYWEGDMPSVDFTYPASNSNGGSFPAQASIAAVPEPSSFLLVGLLTSVCIGIRSGFTRFSKSGIRKNV